MYWTKSPGTGGQVVSEEDFVVEEIISRKFLAKFKRGGSGISRVSGPYTLALLKKKGVTTEDAIRFLLTRFNLRKNDIGYAGLKDKFAVTSQYLTIRGNIREICREDIQLKVMGRTDKMMQIGDLEGNRFTITLKNCRNPNNALAFAKESSKGLPNYFGRQRFGRHGDNHLIGMMILKDRKAALNLINRRNNKNFKSIEDLDKRTLKFYIHAYQSFLFNRLLDKYISLKTTPFSGKFPIVGYRSRLKNDFAGKEIGNMLKKDGITIEDFSIRNLGITCIGFYRDAFIFPKDVEYRIEGKTVVLVFTLPKGSYATVLVREISKT